MIPYDFRICGALPGHDPVELFRSRHTYAPSYFNAVTRDFAPEWDLWVERRMPGNRTISPRISYYRPAVAGYSNGIKLKITAMGDV